MDKQSLINQKSLIGDTIKINNDKIMTITSKGLTMIEDMISRNIHGYQFRRHITVLGKIYCFVVLTFT